MILLFTSQVGQLFQKHKPEVNITLSHQVVDSNGLFERENASILNASLKTWFNENMKAIGKALEAVELHAPFYVVQEDGTLMG